MTMVVQPALPPGLEPYDRSDGQAAQLSGAGQDQGEGDLGGTGTLARGCGQPLNPRPEGEEEAKPKRPRGRPRKAE
jgi:hypothetical protein